MMAKQISLISSGGQNYCCMDTCLARDDKFAYCSPLSTYVYEYDRKYNEYNLSSIVCNHTKLITALAWHPASFDLICSSGADNRLVIWHLSEQKVKASLDDLKGIPTSIQWNPYDHDVIYYILNRKEVYTWFFQTNRNVRFKNDECIFNIETLTFRIHPRNSKIAFAHSNGTISLAYYHNKKTKKYILKEEDDDNGKNENESIFGLEWDVLSDDYLLVASELSGLRLVDVEKECTVCKYYLPSRAIHVRTISWIPDGRGLFVTGDSHSGIVRVWNVSNSKPIESVQIKKNGFLNITVTKIQSKTDGQEGESDETVTRDRPSSSKKAFDVSYQIPKFKFLAMFSDGGTGLYDFGKRDWDFYKEQGHLETIFDCKFSNRDSSMIATASFDGTVKIWSTTSMTVVDSTPVEKNTIIYSVSWSPANMNCVAASTSKIGCFIWDLDKKMIVHRFKDNDTAIYCVNWNQKDPKKIAYSGVDGNCTIRKYEDEKSTIIFRFKHPSTVYGCDWNPMQKEMIATACEDKKVRVYYLPTPNSPLKTFTGHSSKVFSVKWSPVLDGILCSCSDDLKVMIWDYAKEACTMTLVGHKEPIRGLCWNYEIPYVLLTGSWDSTVKIWDIRSGKCMETLNDHVSDVYGLTTCPSKPFVYASSSRDSTIRLYDISSMVENLFMNIILKKNWTEIMIIGATEHELKENTLKTNATPLLFGRYSKDLKLDLDQTRSSKEQYLKSIRLFSSFFSPCDLTNLWDLVDACNNIKEILLSENYYSRIVHWTHLLKSASNSSNRLVISSANRSGILASQAKMDKMAEAAEMYAKIGNLTKYCEIMIELNQWERALAVAPGVSMNYWQDLVQKYIKHLDAKESRLLLPYSVAIGQIDQLTDYYIEQSQFKNALLVTTSYAQGNIKNLNKSQLGKPLMYMEHKPDEELDADHHEEPINMEPLAKVYFKYAEWHFEHGLPVEAACCHLAVNDYRNAALSLLQANMLELLLCLAEFSKQLEPYKDVACSYLWLRYIRPFLKKKTDDETTGDPEKNVFTALDVIAQIKSPKIRELCMQKCCCLVEDIDERLAENVRNQLGVAFKSDCLDLAKSSQSKDDITRSVGYYMLSSKPQKALEIGISHLRSLLKSNDCSSRELDSIVAQLNFTPESVFKELTLNLQKNLCCLSFYNGALLAIRRRYDRVVLHLFENTKTLLKDKDVEVGLNLADVQNEQAVWSNFLNGRLDPENDELRILKNKASDPDDLESGPVITLGSQLPSNTKRSRSYFDRRIIKNACFWLEPKTVAISLNDAIMWFRVTPFSPLINFQRSFPF